MNTNKNNTVNKSLNTNTNINVNYFKDIESNVIEFPRSYVSGNNALNLDEYTRGIMQSDRIKYIQRDGSPRSIDGRRKLLNDIFTYAASAASFIVIMVEIAKWLLYI